MAPRRVTYRFEKQWLEGIEGESVAKTLFDAGIRTLSHSVKYKRPRGIHCGRGRCVMCHMEVNGTPGVPTCITPLRDGMRIRREDFQPFFGPLLVSAVRRVPFPAGFYYRMFARPAFMRRFFLGTLRRMAGVGRLVVGPQLRQDAPEPSSPIARIRSRYDLIVVGAGVSGMAATVSASEAGADVLLVDEYDHLGGHSLGAQRDPAVAAERDRLIDRVSTGSAITHCPRSAALGFYTPNTLLIGPRGGLEPGGVMKRVQASRFVFATGAYDLIPLFENNDIPGIFGPRAIRLFLERDGIRPGSRAVVFGTGRTLADAAALLRHHEIDVAAAVEIRPGGGAGPTEDLNLEPAVIHTGARVVRAHGNEWIRAVDMEGPGGGSRRIDCDLLCAAFPGQGAYELPYQAGLTFELDDDAVEECQVMRATERVIDVGDGVSCHCVGEAAGDQAWREKLSRGEAAGRGAAIVRGAAPRSF